MSTGTQLIANYHPHHELIVHWHALSATIIFDNPWFGSVIVGKRELEDVLYQLEKIGIKLTPKSLTPEK